MKTKKKPMNKPYGGLLGQSNASADENYKHLAPAYTNEERRKLMLEAAEKRETQNQMKGLSKQSYQEYQYKKNRT